ncbi:hypothetical protein [Cupriavidus sp. DF5525]|uniref:hypothetical protein n=1 Tax=Cupriavidus sp. DF5525 TaxID=3160989 RepID=UPI0032DFE57C
MVKAVVVKAVVVKAAASVMPPPLRPAPSAGPLAAIAAPATNARAIWQSLCPFMMCCPRCCLPPAGSLRTLARLRTAAPILVNVLFYCPYTMQNPCLYRYQIGARRASSTAAPPSVLPMISAAGQLPDVAARPASLHSVRIPGQIGLPFSAIALSGQANEPCLQAMAMDVCGSLGGHPETWR